MFHIKQDKRSQTSVGLIVEGLYKCMNEKPFSEITITDVQIASTVGRATFYRLFDSLPDVLAYECDKLFQLLVEKGHSMSSPSMREAIVYFFASWIEHDTLLNAILSSNHLEILYGTFRDYSRTLGSIMHPDLSLSEEDEDYFVTIISLVMVGVLEVWVRRGKKQTPEQLADYVENSLKTLAQSF